ncbi:hypothetical protein EWM64_g9069 [Hericium alpestre]|uniref:Uncharacterized protein n=1 Tax=Hericium alpestre TaxID=135208 RepID=A0A4Y9ZLV4_9AGAM|nr:hypothetical protein EWM64_g9069 [Hericium alpestre]
MEQLPAEDFVYPQKPHCNPPRMHFGLGVKAQSLYEYAFKRRLVPAEWRGDEDCEYIVFQAAVKELDRLCGTKLYLEFPLGTDYDWMVARFTNYIWYYEELEPEEEEEVMDIIRRELGVHDSPRWYHGSRP